MKNTTLKPFEAIMLVVSTFAGATTLAGEMESSPIVEGKQTLETVDQDSWKFSFSPYIHFADLSGDVGLNGQTAGVDAAFEDLADNLEIGASGYFEARKGKWGYGFDGLWLKLSGNGSVNAPIPTDPVIGVGLDLEVVRLKGTVLYRIHEASNTSFDLYAGITYNYVDMQVDVSGDGLLGAETGGRNTEGWFDPVLGIRASHEFNEKWFTRALAEVGGGVESDFNWEAMAVVGYHINKNWDVALAYRGIGIDYEEDGFLYDVTMSGPMLGFSYNW